MSNIKATSGKQSKVLEAELNLKITKIQAIFEKIITNITVHEGKDIVAYVGPTKAGKSTLINCLMKNPLICKKDPCTEETHIIKANSETGPVIGESGESETVIPKGYSNLPGTNLSMWDFPGFGDNKGTEQEIANAAAYERVLRPQKSIRFVLVVPIELIKNDNPMPFFKLLSQIVLICPNVTDSLCIVATKSEKGTVSAWLKKAYDARFDSANNENSEMIKKAKLVIQTVLKKDNCIDFKAPVMSGDVFEGRFLLPNVEKIVALIKGLKGTTVGDFPLVISDQAKSEIQQLHIVYYDKLTSEINDVCERFDNFIQVKIDDICKTQVGHKKPGNSSLRLDIFQEGKIKVMEIKRKSSDTSEFIKEVKKLGFHIPLLAENLERFSFIERIQNMYKFENQRTIESAKQFFKTIMMALDTIANKYSDLIKQSELAIAEENKLEMTFNKQRARERAENEKHKKKIDEERARERVENEERIKKMNEDRKRDLAEIEERRSRMDQDRARERAANERRIMIMERERSRDRAELRELQRDMENQRRQDLEQIKDAFNELQRRTKIEQIAKQTQHVPTPQVPTQQLPMQQLPMQQLPMQQLPMQQLPMQQLPRQGILRLDELLQRQPMQQTPGRQFPPQQSCCGNGHRCGAVLEELFRREQ